MNGVGTGAMERFFDACSGSEVEHEQRLGVGGRRTVSTTTRELEVRAGPGQTQEDAVVAVVVGELPELG